MAVTAIVNETRDLNCVVSWAMQLAIAANETLHVFVLIKDAKKRRSWDEPTLEGLSDSDPEILRETFARLESLVHNPGDSSSVPAASVSDPSLPASASESLAWRIKLLQDVSPAQTIVEDISKIPSGTLVIPGFMPERKGKTDAWQMMLFRKFTGKSIIIRDDSHQFLEQPKILAVVNGDRDDEVALKTAYALANSTSGSIDAVFIEPDIDSVAPQVGRRILNRVVESSLSPDEESKVKRRVVLADNLSQGLKKVSPSDYDLILIGTRNSKAIATALRMKIQSDSTSDMNGTNRGPGERVSKQTQPAIALIRRRYNLRNRFQTWLRDHLERVVPQLDRTQRISLFDRIQSSSHWNFDFVFLIFLSTLIAALGLYKNSVAVVIGAMLVAPLMTPIVGIGLGVTQGNIRLIRTAGKTVLLGFVTAILVSTLAGLALSTEPTAEMRAREYPDMTDWLIALASGIAAAYAMGRPNLLSALPGVAIATALVPPIATVGMALSTSHWHLAGGALLLFCTNIIAIILGTAMTFWSVGLTIKRNGDREHPNWPTWTFLGLVIVAFLLTILMSLNSGSFF